MREQRIAEMDTTTYFLLLYAFVLWGFVWAVIAILGKFIFGLGDKPPSPHINIRQTTDDLYWHCVSGGENSYVAKEVAKDIYKRLTRNKPRKGQLVGLNRR